MLSAISEYSKSQSNNHKNSFIGSNLFDKLFFIINKCDRVQNINSVYFEFGLSIGRKFKHLPLPHITQVFHIGIPDQQRQLAYKFGFKGNSEQQNREAFKKMSKTFTSAKGEVHESFSVGNLKELENVLLLLNQEDIGLEVILRYIKFIYQRIADKRE